MDNNLKNENLSAIGVLKKISLHISNKRKKSVIAVLFLSILSSLAESISIAMLIPFISFFVNPESFIVNDFFKSIFQFFNTSDQKDFLSIITFSFIFIVLLASFIKLRYIKSSNKLTQNITSDFRIKIFKFLINQDYSYHYKEGSNKIMSNLSQKTNLFEAIIFSSINIINGTLITLAITTILIINEPFYTPLIMISIISFFFIIFKIRSAKVLKQGQSINQNQNFIINTFQNTVGYLPEIIIYNLRNFFLKSFSNSSKDIAKSGARILTISMSPRIFLETFFIILVVLVIYLSDFSERSIEANISYLAILAFGTQKSLPLINSIYNLSIRFKSALPSVSDFLNIINDGKKNIVEEQEYNLLKFNNRIRIENLTFRYDKDLPNIISKFSLNIEKGEKVAIKGGTGSGKSTLINIISGILSPSEGSISIDETLIGKENLKNWQKNIAIVPQTIFLNDSTILENIAIALDINSIDLKKVKNASKVAKIDTFIESLPNKYYQKVGERGVRLSGGQRQRIGIARAIYRDTEVIILDEPTNALDTETEKLVMDSISKLDKNITLIMISHSDTSLEFFDKIIDLDKFK